MERKFSSDWFSGKEFAWREHVVPRLKDIVGARWLEVGVYEGRSAFWTLDNVLLGAKSKIYCLDQFDCNTPYLSLWAPNIHYEEVFDSNAGGDPRVVKLKGRSLDLLPTLGDLKLHGAHLDSEHSEKMILGEAELVWPMLLPGGIMVFDDYGWEDQPEAKVAIDKFLARLEVHNEVLFKGFQAIVLKID